MDDEQAEQVLEELKSSIGANVRRAREKLVGKKPLTQAALAKAIGCEVNYVQKLERGRATPSLRLLARLSIVLNKSVRELVRPANPLPKRKLGRPPTKPHQD